jgi:DNA-binding NarL/FixJ family response regulator
MPGIDGVEATRCIGKSWLNTRVIILTTFNDDAYVFGVWRKGALIDASAARKVVTELANGFEPLNIKFTYFCIYTMAKAFTFP